MNIGQAAGLTEVGIFDLANVHGPPLSLAGNDHACGSGDR